MISSKLFPLRTDGAALTSGAAAVAGVGVKEADVEVDTPAGAAGAEDVPVVAVVATGGVLSTGFVVVPPSPENSEGAVIVLGASGLAVDPKPANKPPEAGAGVAGLSPVAAAAGCVVPTAVVVDVDGWVVVVDPAAGVVAVAAGLPHEKLPSPPILGAGVPGLDEDAALLRAFKPVFCSPCPSAVVAIHKVKL